MELELPDESSSEVITIDVEVSENDRRLRDASARSDEQFKLDTEPGTMEPIGRKLQSTTQVVVLALAFKIASNKLKIDAINRF